LFLNPAFVHAVKKCALLYGEFWRDLLNSNRVLLRGWVVCGKMHVFRTER